MKMVVLCVDANGADAVFVADIDPQNQVDSYEAAQEAASDEGYDRPMMVYTTEDFSKIVAEAIALLAA
jgi:hypothetical protein